MSVAEFLDKMDATREERYSCAVNEYYEEWIEYITEEGDE